MNAKKSESEHGSEGHRTLPILADRIGNRIRDAVERIGSRERAAKVAGVSPESLRRWINGSAGPPFLAIAALARESGLSMDWIAWGETAPGAQEVREESAGYLEPGDRLDAGVVREVVEFIEQRLGDPAQASKKAALIVDLAADRQRQADKDRAEAARMLKQGPEPPQE